MPFPQSQLQSVRCSISLAVVLAATVSIANAQLTEPTNEEGLPFRRVEGKHLTIVTDLPSSPTVDELPKVFDAAVPQWCEYFEVPEQTISDWHLTGYLIVSKERFKQANLLPDDLPPFLNGYQRGDKLWFYAQPSDYYTRHLLLHEGTHGFMFNHLGAFGAPWYIEGIAEHFGTHRWTNGKLQMRVMPDSKSDFPYWGRIGLLQRDRKNGGQQPLDSILHYPRETFNNNRAYAWSWGLAAMLDGHPKFQGRFRKLKNYLRKDYDSFTKTFNASFKRDMDEIHDAWELFIENIEYGYDVPESTIHYVRAKPIPQGNNRATVDSKKGWQSSGLRVQAGKQYRIASRGRFAIRKENNTIWWSEPGGVTIEYWRGQPLGILQAAIRPDERSNGTPKTTAQEEDHTEKLGFSTPTAVGLRTVITAPASGVLFFRINEMPGKLHDNHGEAIISVKRLPGKDG